MSAAASFFPCPLDRRGAGVAANAAQAAADSGTPSGAVPRRPLEDGAAPARSAREVSLASAASVLDAVGVVPDHIAMMSAAAAGDAESVRCWLDGDVDVDGRDTLGQTALMYACNAGHVACARELLDAGADVSLRDWGGETAASIAQRRGDQAMTRLLMRARSAELFAEIDEAGFAAERELLREVEAELSDEDSLTEDGGSSPAPKEPAAEGSGDGALLGLRSLLEQAGPLARTSDETLEELRSSMEEALSQVAAEQRQRLRSRPVHHCQICTEQPVNCVFAPCGHAVACTTCAAGCKSQCPICRGPIDQVIRTFFS